MSRKLRINMRANPKPYTTWKPPMEYRGFAKELATIKGIVARYEWVEMTVTVTDHAFVLFTFDTARKWMDVLLKIMQADKRRKRKWLSDEPAVIGEWLWKRLVSPWPQFKIKVRVQADDTLPPEGDMNEKELRIIYGEKYVG